MVKSIYLTDEGWDERIARNKVVEQTLKEYIKKSSCKIIQWDSKHNCNRIIGYRDTPINSGIIVS